MNRTILACSLAVLSCVTIRGEIIDRILAVVGGELITLSDARAALRLGLVTPSDKSADPVRSALDALIARQLEVTEVNRYLPPEPTEEAITARVEAVRSRVGSQAEFERVLTVLGMSAPQLRQRLRDDLRIDAYLDQRFGAAIQVTDDDLIEYYRAHGPEFSKGGAPPPFGEVRDAVREKLVAERRTILVRDWLVGLRRRAEISDLYLTVKPEGPG
jgi:hypothetical protein